MQISRFNAFVSELNRMKLEGVSGLRVVRRSHERWVNDDHSEVDEELRSKYNLILAKGSPWRARNSAEVLFPVDEIKCLVITTFPSQGRRKGLKRIHEEIRKCHRHSTDAFNASHDPLTGIFNKLRIDELLVNEIAETPGPTASDRVPATYSVSGKNVGMMCLDIDLFKQVNDSYGHEYGDILLMVFTRRLQHEIGKVVAQNPGLSLSFGRSGGEEFTIVASGVMTEAQFISVGEILRGAIAREPLPSETEWKIYQDIRGMDDMDFPHASERRVTISIGLSSILKRQTDPEARQLRDVLKKQADISLQKAKSGGRNAIRYFPNLRHSYGTVIEHHQETNVVIIDIGKQVDVQNGQEFMVFHPDFTGQVPYTRSDGRSKKTLGIYPRRNSGRIVVFEAQAEISFCTISENHGQGNFATGSHLEFVMPGPVFPSQSDRTA